jgi:phage repressor protein C with HTH and peptisase S24 domain
LQRVADAVGCAKSYLSEVEHENRLPEEAMLRKIERAMKMSKGVLVEAGRWQRGLAAGGETLETELARLRASDEARRRLQELLRTRGGLDAAYRSGELGALVEDEGSKVRTYVVADVRRALPREVPLINKVAAGYPTEFTDLGYPARVADEYVRAPDIDDPDAFAARVVGDSMEPEYREGDVIVFSPGKVVKSGDDCFVRLEKDGETTFKRVYFEGTSEAGAGGLIRLQPLNNAYAARVVRREEVAGLYAAVTWIRKLGGGR